MGCSPGKAAPPGGGGAVPDGAPGQARESDNDAVQQRRQLELLTKRMSDELGELCADATPPRDAGGCDEEDDGTWPREPWGHGAEEDNIRDE